MIEERRFTSKHSAVEFIEEAKKKRYIRSYSIGYTDDYCVVVTMILTELGAKEL